ncbi:MAG: hypothetical protein V3S24_11775 [Candidatus Tectomicrobia bacterium]
MSDQASDQASDQGGLHRTTKAISGNDAPLPRPLPDALAPLEMGPFLRQALAGERVTFTVQGFMWALSKNNLPVWRRMFGQRQGGAEGAYHSYGTDATTQPLGKQ